jgi:hypothetical protein
MKKLTKKNESTTKTKTVSKGTLKEIANIKKSKNEDRPEIVKATKISSVLPVRNVDKISQDKTVTTKTSKALLKKGDKNSSKEDSKDQYVMIEKSVTVTRTSTTFLDDDEEDELFNDDWFGGSKLKKQKQIEEGMEEEDLDTIIESFGKDDDKYW